MYWYFSPHACTGTRMTYICIILLLEHNAYSSYRLVYRLVLLDCITRVAFGEDSKLRKYSLSIFEDLCLKIVNFFLKQI